MKVLPWLSVTNALLGVTAGASIAHKIGLDMLGTVALAVQFGALALTVIECLGTAVMVRKLLYTIHVEIGKAVVLGGGNGPNNG